MQIDNWLAFFAKNTRSSKRRLSELRGERTRRFEQLEERTLLSISPAADYSRVAPEWFAAPVDAPIPRGRQGDSG